MCSIENYCRSTIKKPHSCPKNSKIRSFDQISSSIERQCFNYYFCSPTITHIVKRVTRNYFCYLFTSGKSCCHFKSRLNQTTANVLLSKAHTILYEKLYNSEVPCNSAERRKRLYVLGFHTNLKLSTPSLSVGQNYIDCMCNLRFPVICGVDEFLVVFLYGSSTSAGRAEHIVSDAMHGGCCYCYA